MSTTPIAENMKALLITEANSLRIATLATPNPGSGELLVQILASGINPSDVLNASGGFPYTTFPRVPGLAEDAVVEKPANLTFAQAATIGVPYTTASLALRQAQALPQEVVLVLGATGSVGSAVTQLASSSGCSVLTASRSATTDINLLIDPDLTNVRTLTGGRGADVVIDTTGDPKLLNAALKILAHGGRLSVMAAPRSGHTNLTFDLKYLYRNEQTIVGCNTLSHSPSDMATELRTMVPLFESGQLKVVNEEKLNLVGLDESLAAYDSIKHGVRGKFVIRPSMQR